MAGNLSVETCGAGFAKVSRQASSNYGIGTDGRIALYVEEKNRSWCSGNKENDNRAITIEVANTVSADPWPVSDKAYAALIALLVDICQRNGIKRLLWQGDKSLIGQVDKQNMTVHRWFQAKACPGDWLYSRHGAIAAAVNARLTKTDEEDEEMSQEQFNAMIENYLNSLGEQNVPGWAKAEFQEAIDAGITDGERPMQLIPRYQSAIIAKRAMKK